MKLELNLTHPPSPILSPLCCHWNPRRTFACLTLRSGKGGSLMNKDMVLPTLGDLPGHGLPNPGLWGLLAASFQGTIMGGGQTQRPRGMGWGTMPGSPWRPKFSVHRSHPPWEHLRGWLSPTQRAPDGLWVLPSSQVAPGLGLALSLGRMLWALPVLPPSSLGGSLPPIRPLPGPPTRILLLFLCYILMTEF